MRRKSGNAAVKTGEEEGEVVVEWNRHDGDLLQSGVFEFIKSGRRESVGSLGCVMLIYDSLLLLVIKLLI